MTDKRKRPRWLQWLRAYLGGYFWGPCPICGEAFGGHETDIAQQVWWTSPREGRAVCANCAEEAQRRSARFVRHAVLTHMSRVR